MVRCRVLVALAVLLCILGFHRLLMPDHFMVASKEDSHSEPSPEAAWHSHGWQNWPQRRLERGPDLVPECWGFWAPRLCPFCPWGGQRYPHQSNKPRGEKNASP
jgi:hypothetical protein